MICCKRCLQRESSDPIPSHTPGRPTEGRISNAELWTLVVNSAASTENDKLSEAIMLLTQVKHDDSTQTYGTFSEETNLIEKRNLTDFERLCGWKNNCADTEQMDKLFEACLQAQMGETVEELKGFRNKVSAEVSEYDLEHILWQIGKKSSENITMLLSNLTKTRFSQESSVLENIRRALPVLLKWTRGNLDINPAVMLSLLSDDLCDKDKYFFIVAEEDKRPLPDADIKQHVRNVSRAHCKKIISISSTNGKSRRKKEEKDVNSILDENKTDLFDTYEMIKDWLDKQECSNYEKRKKLQIAVDGAKETSKSNEISLDKIEQLASSKGNAEAAYELLMRDIKPFAAILRLDDSKLIKYKQVSSSPQSPRGTIGLVADVMAKKGKK